MEKEFENLYKKLNKKQKEAVDAIDGPVMVIAGPGTGKTQILSLRIANILKQTDTSPDSILCLTFTESGVHSMRKRLGEIIGNDSYQVNIFTFHSFCNSIIKNYPEEFPRIISSKNISPVDQVKIMELVIEDSELETLRPYGDNFYYARSISASIGELKREGVSPDDFEKLIKEDEKEFSTIDDLYHEKGVHKGKMKGKYGDIKKYVDRNKELLTLYRNYEKKLVENRFYDYEDMIIETVKAMQKNDDFLLKLQENYQYILVDEHQDTNNAQNKVLELLSGFYESPNLFIVGDEKQAIFRFQGASLNNFLFFKNKYKDAKIIFLEENYRSTQTILDSAHSLIENAPVEDEKMRIRLKSASGHKEKNIKFYEFSSEEFETLYLAEDIKNKISEGVPAGEIAVIYRDNRDAMPLVDVLEKTEIPFVVDSDQDIFEDEDVRKVQILLSVIADPLDDMFFAKALHLDFLGIDEFEIYKIFAQAKKEKKSIVEFLKNETEKKESEFSKTIEFSKKLSAWTKLSHNKNLVEFLEIIVNESGFLNSILAISNPDDKLQKIAALFESAKQLLEGHRDSKLAEFLEYLKILEEKRLIKVKKNGTDKNKVHLMTAHRSKGLEFDVVYIFGLYDGHWGNRRHPTHFKLPLGFTPGFVEHDQNDDERRLFYVALTRARKHISLSYSRENNEGRGFSQSMFLSEIRSDILDKEDIMLLESKLSSKKIVKFSPRINKGTGIKDKDFLNTLFLERGLSVTALNNYLKCPWNYFYSNLIRVPKALNKFSMYGTATHAALKYFFDKLKKDESPDKKTLLNAFKNFAQFEPFDSADLTEILKKGEESLSGYYDFYEGKWEKNIVNEFNISGVVLDGVKLTGQIDKIEILDGGSRVNVVDYKTKKPLSRNEIEGTAKNSDGNYKRQLIFYKLLLDNFDNGKYNVVSGDIDFIEPNSSGKYKKENFSITSDDVEALREKIKEVSREIMDLSFWDKRCEDKDCEYCPLRNLLN